MVDSISKRFMDLNPKVDFWSLRHVDDESKDLSVRQDVLEPTRHTRDQGAMITVFHEGGYGYAATPDLSSQGLKTALEKATDWAKTTARFALFDPRQIKMPAHQGKYCSPVKKPLSALSLKDQIHLLQTASKKLHADARIVDWEASLSQSTSRQTYFTSQGAHIEQDFTFMVPNLVAIANHGSNTQFRSLSGRGMCRQSGLEILDDVDFTASAERISREAIELLLADNCPSGNMDLLLSPDQMMLQIHESIGHPLELDRILGDERNYAGTSFVTLDMFGTYAYGSKLLNVSFDPTLEGEFAAFNFDDDGSKAEKVLLIENGILKRPLGGITSQTRSGLPGVSNVRACNWNRPPIDRMANLNVEPGTDSFDDIVQSVEKGVFMKSNISWSIDDSRNKFQFGCEWAQLIENGKLTRVVRNPNYRGISANFWRNLKKVGNSQTFEIYGTPTCGKGEPNQAIRVGHASPACLFANVDVFGGES